MAYRTHCLICTGTGCVSGGSCNLRKILEAEIAKRNLDKEIQVITTGCQGFCAEGPIMIVQPDGVFYCRVGEREVPQIVEEHLLKGRPVKKLLYTPPTDKAPIPALKDIPFFAKQKLVVLRNRGLIDPDRIRAVSSPQTNAPAPIRSSISKSNPLSKMFLPSSPYW